MGVFCHRRYMSYTVRPSVRQSIRPSVRRITHVTQKLFKISSQKFAGIFFGKIYNDFWNNLWPSRSKLASKAKSKISNIHSSEVIRDIQKKLYYKVFWSNMQLLTLINFDLRGQNWPLRPNKKFQTFIARKL